ncbi:hypothetical protein BU26DRAFT_50948 [Trematosphaeria pertusa]|uniref:Uncharacterized protein n=1 Tax=Trematosphaeria pertusa TaxID=390896 RepID=A0A6A6I8I5_9PLEO|nr:uncharacterized protein BU26DRAFT_50948 [Trematosphaeria pertusa]KAF2246666.1 hypothetical protein BU26DRAFT_50948 [Trematosphaeria pertusa]
MPIPHEQTFGQTNVPLRLRADTPTSLYTARFIAIYPRPKRSQALRGCNEGHKGQVRGEAIGYGCCRRVVRRHACLALGGDGCRVAEGRPVISARSLAVVCETGICPALGSWSAVKRRYDGRRSARKSFCSTVLMRTTVWTQQGSHARE